MGYPSGVFTATTKNTGDAIQASHVNDLQTEVTAIETALITGPVQLPQSCLTSLSVSGGSTFAGAITLGAAVTVTGVVHLLTQPRCALVHGSSQTLSTGVEVAVTFDTETFDVGAMHSTATNPTRISLTSSGDYEMHGFCCFNASGTGERYAYWRLNGTTFIGGRTELAGQGSAAFVGLAPWAAYRAASTADYVELIAFTKDVAPLNDGGGTAGLASRAYVAKVG